MPSRTLVPTRPLAVSLPKFRSYFKATDSSDSFIPYSHKSVVDTLPSHIIREVGRHCELFSDVLHFSLCSRRIRALLLPYLYSNVELRTNKHCKSTLISLSKRLEHARHIRRLVISPNSAEWTAPGEEIDEGLVANLVCTLTPHLRSLEYFAWAGWEMPPDDLWLALRKSCGQLKGISSVIGDQPLNPTSQLFAFSNLTQFSLSVKTRSLDWLAAGPPKIEKLPRRLWEMLIERCPRLEELSLDATAPAHRTFDARNVLLGRWPRLRSIVLGDMLLQDRSKDSNCPTHDYQAFMKFFSGHSQLQHIALQHAGASTIFPSAFALPFSALPRLQSFHGPLRYLRSIPHPEKLRYLSLTSLHHTMSSIQPTFTALQDFPNIESLGVWVDLSFGGQQYVQDEAYIFAAFLGGCPMLRHLELMCFTRPTFRIREFSKALRHAPNLQSFTLTKMYKSSDEDMTSNAVRILQENPSIQRFTLQYTQDRWPTLSPSRLKQMGVYHAICDEYGYPESIQASEWKLKTFGAVSTRRFTHVLSSKLPPNSPGWEARSPRSSISSDSRSWHRRSGSQTSFVVV